jgi:hypothetical protein
MGTHPPSFRSSGFSSVRLEAPSQTPSPLFLPFFHFYCFSFLTDFTPFYVMRKKEILAVVAVVFVVRAVYGVAASFLSTLLFNQFVGYRPAIQEIPGERGWRTYRPVRRVVHAFLCQRQSRPNLRMNCLT